MEKSQMHELQKLLDIFVRNPEDPEVNFKLANYYYSIGQTASAVSYYIRTSERTEDKKLMYTCLLAAANCFDLQGCRGNSVRGMLKNAMTILPQRPEAYFFLSRFYEREKNYQDSYLIASLGEKFSNKDSDSLEIDVGYPGFYGIIFEKAVSSWHCGLCDESCELHYQLRMNKELDRIHRTAVNNNIEKLFKEKRMSRNNKSIIDRFYEDPNCIAWGNYDKDPVSKEYVYSELINGIYSKFFDVEEGDIVFDVGSCVGLYPLTILNNKPKEVHCFEPNTILFNAMKENLKDFGNVYLNHCGISKSKEDNIFLDTSFAYDHENEKYASTTTFKDYIEENGIKKIDVLKTDCEGGEWDIFTEENYSWIKNNVRKVCGEFHIHNNPLFRKKFIEFRNLYLKNAENVVVFYSNKNADVYEINVWDDTTVENISYCNISFELSPEESLNFSFSKSYKSTSWIIDNFYEDPDLVRKFALNQDYDIGGIGRGYIGNRTYQQFLFPGLKERFEEIMGQKIVKWEDYGMNGRFQYCWSGQPVVYHCDRQMWGGMIYLTPDAPFECGTTLYAHKKTRARTYNEDGYDYSWKNIPGDPHLDGTPFEPVDVHGNVYNRLAIFDASCIHSASEYFGTVKENCRLWQMFFFDTETN